MEKTSFFLGRQNQCSENSYISKTDVQIKCNASQSANSIPERTSENNPIILTGEGETQNSKSNPRHQKTLQSQILCCVTKPQRQNKRRQNKTTPSIILVQKTGT